MDVKKMHWSCKFSYLDYIAFDGRWHILKLGALHAYLVVQTMKQHSAPSTNTYWGLQQFKKTKQKSHVQHFFSHPNLNHQRNHNIVSGRIQYHTIGRAGQKSMPQPLYYHLWERLIPGEIISWWAATPAHEILYHICSPEWTLFNKVRYNNTSSEGSHSDAIGWNVHFDLTDLTWSSEERRICIKCLDST